MLYSDQDILHAVAQEKIIIKPFDLKSLQPASYDLHLGDDFYYYHQRPDLESRMLRVQSDSFVLYPLSFALGTTEEWLEIPAEIAAKLEGKSSLARLGLFIHITAGFIDPGFKGKLTIEMFNAAPVPRTLKRNMAIAQVAFQQLVTPARNPYGSFNLDSHYQGQETTKQSVLEL